MKTALAALTALVLAASMAPCELFAQSVPPRYVPEALGSALEVAPLRVAERGNAPSATLPSGEVVRSEEFDALRDWNAAGRTPQKIGILRRLESPFDVIRIIDPGTGEAVFAGSIRVEGTPSLRLHLTVSSDAHIAVWGLDGKAYSINCADACWSPVTFGDISYIESDAAATVDEVIEAPSHNVTAFAREGAVPVCFIDATCVSATTLDVVADYRRAVAQLYFVTSEGGFGCTGALINNNAASGTPQPYLLTANHCISTAAEAASLQAFWDYRSTICGGSPTPLASVPRSTGASILATSATTDFSLLRLNTVPSGRAYLGWDANASAVPTGTTLYRISHPIDSAGSPYGQLFSSAIVNTTASCGPSLSRPSFFFATLATGATDGGSSGAPTIKTGGYIVGQLYGRCFPTGVTDPCSNLNQPIDGAFSGTYQSVANFLSPTTSSCTACIANANTACLLGGRFKATLTWHDFSANQAGAGSVIKYADNLAEISPTYGPVSESVFFSMYPSAPKSIEAIVRMLKGVGINNMYWVFLSGFATAEYTVTVTDTQTCQTWTRTMPTGASNITRDFNAFPLP